MYEFVITEVTKYGDTANCVGGFLFENGQPIGRKRLYIKDTNWASQYPPNRKFTLLQKLTFQKIEEGIVERNNMFTEGCYPREERIEDITVFPDEIKAESISEQEIWQMFETLEIPLIDFPKYFPEFETKPSFKVFCAGKAMLDLTCRPSLFYFRLPVDQVRIERQINKYKADTEEWYLRYDIDSERRFSKKLKMMSSVHDGQFYQTELAKKPQRIVACLGISQYFDGPEVSPENKGYYLNCNEVYFSV